MKTMRQVLAECTEQQFEHIARLWAMTGEPNQGSRQRQEMLMKRVQDPIAAHFVWEQLSEAERKVLYRALSPSMRYGVRRDALQKKAQLSATQYDAAVTNLTQYVLLQENQVQMQGNQVVYAIVSSNKKAPHVEQVAMLYAFNESLTTLYNVGREVLAPLGDRSEMTLEKILSPLYEGDLYSIVRSYNMEWGTYYSRADFRSMIAEKLLELEEPLDFLSGLDAQSRNLYKWLRERGGKANMREVRAYTHLDDSNLLKVLHTLAQCAIAFDTFSKQERVLFIPQDMYANLKSVTVSATPEAEERLVVRETAVQTIRVGETSLLYDLVVLIGAIYQQSIEPTQVGRIPKRIASKLRPMLRGQPRVSYMNEDDYLEMLCDIASELSIMRLSKSPLQNVKPHYEAGTQLERWSQLTIVEQTRVLLQDWISSFRWRDVYGVNYTSMNTYSWHPMTSRGVILTHLSKCTPGRWYTVTSLLKTIWDEDAFALRPVHPHNRKEQSKNNEAYEKWKLCDGEVYTGLLASTLYELGIVTLGYERPDALEAAASINPDAFMLTELGATLLRAEQASAPTVEANSEAATAQRSLIVQPNFEVLLLQPDLPTLYSLLPFAQINQIGVASRLTLTRASLLRGLEAGKTIEQILSVLAERSQKELPQNVEYTLRDWVKHYKAVDISQVLLFEVSSEDVAQTLSTLPNLQEFGVRQLGPRTIVVSGNVDLQGLKRELDKQGIVVHVSGDIITRPNSHSFTFGRPR